MKTKQRVYYEDEEFIVLDCLHCGNTVYVWKEFINPTRQQIDMMVTDSVSRFPQLYPDDRDTLCIDNHYYFHMRSKL